MLKTVFFKTLFQMFMTKGGVILACSIAITVLIDLLGSFQLTERIDVLAIDLLGGVLGPFYGLGHRVGQDNITVLLVDRQTLDEVGSDRWPPDYAVEADFAEWAASDRPAAIFLDFYYARPHQLRGTAPALDAFSGARSLDADGADVEGIADLAARLQRTRRSGTQVFIGPVGTDPALEPLSRIPQVGIDRIELPRDAYPVRDSGGNLQAAFALYDVACAGLRLRCADMEKELARRDLAIQWGFGASRKVSEFVPEHCRGGSLGRRIWSVFEIAFMGLVPSAGDVEEGRSGKYAVCAYADSFPIIWLRSPPPGFDPRPFIEGRIVLIGSNVGWLADFVEAPLYGSVPGVMAHAMALDNLLQSHDRAARIPGRFIGDMTYRDFLELCIEILGLLVIVATNTILQAVAGKAQVKAWVWWTTQVSVAIAVPALLGLVMSRVFAWPVVNVVSIAGMAILALFLLAKELRGEKETHTAHSSV